jgi:hypothetical protein
VALPGTYTQSAVQESVPPPIESLGGFLDKNQEIIESKKPPKSEKTQTEVALIPETLSQKELQTVPPLDNLGSTTPNWRVLPPLPGIGETWIQADSATQVTIISHERNNDFQVIGRDDDGEVCVINRNDILKGYWKRVALPANCEVSND